MSEIAKTVKQGFRIPPWIWLGLLYISFLAAWTALILIAVRHTPETVPLEISSAKNIRHGS